MNEPQINYFEMMRLLDVMNLGQFIEVDDDGRHWFNFKPYVYICVPDKHFDVTSHRIIYELRKLLGD